MVVPGRIEWGDLVVAQKSDAILKGVWESKEAEGRGGSKLPPKVHDPHPEWSILVRVWPSIRLKEVPQGPKA